MKLQITDEETSFNVLTTIIFQLVQQIPLSFLHKKWIAEVAIRKEWTDDDIRVMNALIDLREALKKANKKEE